jgi:NADPH-dependent curcumin reductase CurA
MNDRNRGWLLVRRPKGEPTENCFEMVESPVQPIEEGEVLVRNHFLSLDPYMRGRMDDVRSYAQPQQLGAVMQGGTVGLVVDSRNPSFKVGAAVVGRAGWQLYGRSDGSDLRLIDASRVPMQAWLGAVGMPGITAWFGVNDILQPQAGQTLLVSAASGAVGTVVGQLAKMRGCRVVGIAGGAEKCAVVKQEFGFDACVDYKAGRLAQDLAEAVPNGIDHLFENVGGVCLDTSLARMNAFGRVAVCGLISGYNGEPMPITNFRSVLVNRLTVRGFIISEHASRWPAALEELSALAASGKLRWRETISDGLDSAPSAFIGLLRGKNLGKQLVRL